MKLTVKEIATYLHGRVVGNEDIVVSDFGSIADGKEGSLSFLSNPAYEEYIYTTACSAVLVSDGYEPSKEVKTTLIYVPDAYAALAQLLKLREGEGRPEPGISELAVVDATAKIDPTSYVGPLAYVGKDAKVGPHTYIMPQAYVGTRAQVGAYCKVYEHAVLCARTIVGNRCVIHSGAVIGADGFGFAKTENGYTKIPQTGNVVLEDDVEVGANTCIDRAVLDSTIIRKGVKLDNLVMIAHNVEVGAHSVLAGQSGVAGSSRIGEWNTLAGQVGVSGHIKTAREVTLAAQTGVISDIKDPNTVWFGSPAQPHLKSMKAAAKYIHLPEMDREIANLKEEIEELKRELAALKEVKGN